ncbi:hypothetical protein ABZ078_23650 [Streptomyces sp. NPDC006385]
MLEPGSRSYEDLAAERDLAQVAVITALARWRTSRPSAKGVDLNCH